MTNKLEIAGVGGCCVAAIALAVLEVFALVWAILDITGPNAHRTLDIVIFVVIGLSLLSGGARQASRA